MSEPTTALRRAVRRVVAVVVGLCALVLLGATAAQAHNQLVSTDPPADAVLPVMPDHITLTFAEDVSPLGVALMVHRPDQAVVNVGVPTTNGPVVSQAIAGDLPAGLYKVMYRVTSDDGHAVEGEYTFTTQGPTTIQGAGAPVDPAGGAAAEQPMVMDHGTMVPVTPSAEPVADPDPATASSPAAAAPVISELPEARHVPVGVLLGIAAVLVAAGGLTAVLLMRRRPLDDDGNLG
ncbi:copper resistance CopC family protein [Cellulomonas sp. URHD0024]|uniref:copper resistance CopC family protein n=1 Tax=Cellulomonas sp. URHD0024 TaxID=1302620 RepID=UPI0003FC7491|nr:copper resistance CopC family protein [Cellulomonas sp. URHD0024]